MSRSRSRSPRRRDDDRGEPRERISILCRNLPLDTRQEELRDLFERYGKVRDVYLPNSHKPKGFGFIEFYERRDAEDAVDRLDKFVFGGRELQVVFSKQSRKSPHEMRRQERSSVPDKRRDRGGEGSRRDRSRSRDRGRRYRSRSTDRRRQSRSYSRSRSPPKKRAHSRSRSRSKSASSLNEKNGSPAPGNSSPSPPRSGK